MTQPDYQAFFARYADAYNRSLGDHVEVDAIRGFFAETSLALSTEGGVQPATNAELGPLLEKMYAFYKAVGTKGLNVDRIAVEPIADGHDRVEVFYRAEYDKGGESLTIPFSVTYLVQRRDDGPKIFAFIAGDEQALMREHGLIDAQGQPVN